MSSFALRRHSDIVEKCYKAARMAMDADGYVAMPKLVGLLDAEVVFRPLLVEAIIAKKNDLNKPGPHWKILLNEDTFSQDKEIYPSENGSNRLSVRIRNTIAHELIHTFQFKVEDSCITLGEVSRSVSRSDAIIRRVEKEAHELTSLLLLPLEVLKQELTAITEVSAIRSYLKVYEKFGVSRAIFIQALNNLRKDTGSKILEHTALSDVMFGIGSWDNSQEPYFEQWPTFENFSGNSLPDFTFDEASSSQSRFTIPQLTKESVLNGGKLSNFQFTTYEGSRNTPRYRNIEYVLSVEERKAGLGVPFLFMLRRVREIASR